MLDPNLPMKKINESTPIPPGVQPLASCEDPDETLSIVASHLRQHFLHEYKSIQDWIDRCRAFVASQRYAQEICHNAI